MVNFAKEKNVISRKDDTQNIEYWLITTNIINNDKITTDNTLKRYEDTNNKNIKLKIFDMDFLWKKDDNKDEKDGCFRKYLKEKYFTEKDDYMGEHLERYNYHFKYDIHYYSVELKRFTEVFQRMGQEKTKPKMKSKQTRNPENWRPKFFKYWLIKHQENFVRHQLERKDQGKERILL